MNGFACWAKRRWRLAVSLLGAVALFIVGLSILVDRLETRDQRRQTTYAVINEVCDAINEMPSRIASALAKSERIRQITGPTTTLPPTDLTEEELAEVERLRAGLASDLAALGEPVDCYRRAS